MAAGRRSRPPGAADRAVAARLSALRAHEADALTDALPRRRGKPRGGQRGQRIAARTRAVAAAAVAGGKEMKTSVAIAARQLGCA